MLIYWRVSYLQRNLKPEPTHWIAGNIIELLPGMFMDFPATFDCRKAHERTSSEKAYNQALHPNII